MTEKQVTITGGAGFIGANLAAHYLSRGHRVVVYDTLARRGAVENLAWLKSMDQADNLEVVVGDVRTPSREFREAVETSDAVFHMAAQVAVTTSVVDPAHDFEVNALGTFRLLEIVRLSDQKKPWVLYASTNKVYGGMEDVAVAEDDDRYRYRDLPGGIPEDRLLDFHSPYGCSKGCADQYVRDYSRIYELPTVVFRQSCIYGYRQFGIEDQGWVAWFIIAAMLGRPITIFGNGKQVRDVLFIDDLIEAYDLAWQKPEASRGKVFNIGGGPQNAISLRDLLGYLGNVAGAELNLSYDDWRPGDQPVYVSDISMAERELGWKPRTSWSKGAERLTGWVRENLDMLKKMF